MVCLIISTFDSKIIFSRLNMRSSTKATILQQLLLISTTCKSSPKCYLVFASLMFSCHKQCNFYFCNYSLVEPPKKARPLAVCVMSQGDIRLTYLVCTSNLQCPLDTGQQPQYHKISKLNKASSRYLCIFESEKSYMYVRGCIFEAQIWPLNR